jgi:hypothetical protein
LLQYIVIILIHFQIELNEATRFESQVPGDPFYVDGRKQWSCGLTTIGAMQAICFPEFILMQFVHQHVQVFGWFLPESGKEFTILPVLFPCLFRKLFQYFFHGT